MSTPVYYKTKCEGLLHIASSSNDGGSNYIGSVNSYNNGLTRFFSKIFKKSINVTLNGRTRSVNKMSYLKLLGNAGIADANSKNIKNFVNLDSLKLTSDKHPMSAYLPKRKQYELGKKMVKEMVIGRWQNSERYAHKGADLNLQFFKEDKIRLRFGDYIPFARGYGSYRFDKTYETYQPVLYAARHGRKNLCETFKKLGADLNVSGHQSTFKRRLLDVDTHHHFDVETHLYTNQRGNLRAVPTVALNATDTYTYRDTVHVDTEYRTDNDFNFITTTVDKKTDLGTYAKSYTHRA